MDNNQLPAIQIQIRHHRQTLDHRALDRVIQTSIFAEAWTFATGGQRERVLSYINHVDYAEVKDWVLRIMVGTLERCSMKILRELARYHQVKNYSRLSKSKLLIELSTKGAKDGGKNVDGDD